MFTTAHTTVAWSHKSFHGISWSFRLIQPRRRLPNEVTREVFTGARCLNVMGHWQGGLWYLCAGRMLRVSVLTAVLIRSERIFENPEIPTGWNQLWSLVTYIWLLLSAMILEKVNPQCMHISADYFVTNFFMLILIWRIWNWSMSHILFKTNSIVWYSVTDESNFCLRGKKFGVYTKKHTNVSEYRYRLKYF